ncbi:MAG: hypothetical protein JWQ65_1016, partial [Devosia sp.]|nr:hypothetical protein [Devosia sp.]
MRQRLSAFDYPKALSIGVARGVQGLLGICIQIPAISRPKHGPADGDLKLGYAVLRPEQRIIHGIANALGNRVRHGLWSPAQQDRKAVTFDMAHQIVEPHGLADSLSQEH